MMNERIKELAEQAGFGPGWFEESPPGYPALPRQGIVRTFAESIVRECVTKCKADQHGDSLDDICIQMLEHFGVE